MTSNLPAELQPLAGLVETIHRLEDRVKKLERTKPVPGVIPLVGFPAWYQRATDSPVPPISEAQLRNWSKRPRHYRVDWIVRRGRAVYVDSERFCKWIRRPHPGVRVRKGVRG